MGDFLDVLGVITFKLLSLSALVDTTLRLALLGLALLGFAVTLVTLPVMRSLKEPFGTGYPASF